MTGRFEAYCHRREQAALTARIPGYATREDIQPPEMVAIRNDWSQALFDGPFYRSAAPPRDGTPVTSLVFVQSRDGNTGAADPSTLGGGDTDLHLIYEGLSRVDADAVLAGAATARAKEIVFSVWHPKLVALRLTRGRARHPAQVVVTDSANLRFEDGLMFHEPSLRVFVITRTRAVQSVRHRVAASPWIDVIDAGEPVSFERAFRYLRSRGIEVMSCVGGRRTATALLKEDLVSDIYLTTSAREGGEPDTPYYEGPPLPHDRILLKDGRDEERGITFEHLRVRAASETQV
jgi:riboflavin biosynthesis pyrimidine reductase